MPASDSVIWGFSQFFILVSFGEFCFKICHDCMIYMGIVDENRNDGSIKTS
jgi:hypothetical protein